MCFPEELKIHEETLAPFTLDGLTSAAEAIPNSTGRYWRITTPEGAVSHLWGTMHSNHPAVLDLPDRVEGDIRSARAVALEVDFLIQSRAEYKRWALAEDMIAPTWSQEPRFRDLALPPHIEDWIRQRTDGLGWGTDAPDYLTMTGLAALMLSAPCDDFAAGIYPTQDSLIQMYGAIEGARIIGLESTEAFGDVLSDPGNFYLVQAIMAIYGAYLNPDRTAEGTATGLAMYLRGQIGVWMLLDRAYAMDMFGERQAQRFLDLTNGYLLDTRNANFLETALPELREGGVFMAVGAFHLPGEAGLVSMLRQAGFTVERVPLPGEAP